MRFVAGGGGRIQDSYSFPVGIAHFLVKRVPSTYTVYPKSGFLRVGTSRMVWVSIPQMVTEEPVGNVRLADFRLVGFCLVMLAKHACRGLRVP